MCFTEKNGQRRSKYLAWEGKLFFVEKLSSKKFFETDSIKMLQFLINNIFVTFGGRVFKQTDAFLCIPNCAPILASIFIYSYKTDLKQGLLKEAKRS